MPLHTFGWTDDAVTTDRAGNVKTGVELTVYADEDKTTQVTQLYADDGTTLLAKLLSDTEGRFGFKASDAYSLLYIFGGSSTRPYVLAAHEVLDAGSASVEAAAAAAQASATAAQNAANLVGAPADTAVNTLVTPGSGSTTEATLNSTFAAQAKLGIVLPDSVSYTDLQAAADSAATFGTRLWAAGSLTTTSTLTLLCDADLTGLTYNYTGTGTAVIVGSAAVLNRKQVNLPKITYGNKPTTGWTAGTEGVRIINTNGCTITVDRVTGFESGMTVYGQGQGNVHNTFNIGHLENNKRNQVLDADATGWSNSNLYVGGRYSHESTEGTAVAGTRHILLKTTTNIVNGNTWINPSIEGVENEFCLDIDSGQYNVLLNPRTESTGGARIRWGAGAVANKIIGGYTVSTAVITRVTGEQRNTIEGVNRYEVFGSNTLAVLRLMNMNSSASASAMIYEPGQFDANWAWSLAADAITGKRPAESFPRCQLDRVNGRLYLGNGAAALAIYLAPVSTSGIGLYGGNLYFGTDNTQDIGLAGALRPRYVRVGTAIQTGAGTSRPSASTAGAGAMFFDTTLKKPIWSDGTGWFLADGTAA